MAINNARRISVLKDHANEHLLSPTEITTIDLIANSTLPMTTRRRKRIQNAKNVRDWGTNVRNHFHCKTDSSLKKNGRNYTEPSLL